MKFGILIDLSDDYTSDVQINKYKHGHEAKLCGYI
jgi:hypothetical protein